MAWLWAERRRVRKAIYKAEVELGWLGWEQVDFFELPITEEVNKVQESERTQASLLNTSAELAARKAVFDKELAGEKALHDQTQASLAEERAPVAAALEEAEAKRRQKLEAVERFDRAVEEIARLEKQLEARSLAFMKIERPDISIRTEARKVSDELGRLSDERQLVLADKVNAAQEAARIEPGIAQLRAELERLDTAASAVRERLAGATRRLTGEMRALERERRKSNMRMSHLDREKRKPYQRIGAVLADHGIYPLNQPQVFEKVLALRERDARIAETLSDLRGACAAVNHGMLIAFYFLLAAILVAVVFGACQFIH
jgi:chromosome segregation ATPase